MTKRNLFFPLVYAILFLLGLKALFHGFPDIERFFAEWWDERLTLTYIMKFGTFNFSPTMIMHPPLYHYLTFIPIGTFYVLGKLLGFFHDKIDFARFYFNDTQYFFLIARSMSYLFYCLSAMMVYRIVRFFFSSLVSHITTLAYLLIPAFLFEYSATRPETLLLLNSYVFLYFCLRFYLDGKRVLYLYLASLFLGISIASKYNALYLGAMLLPLLFYNRKDMLAAGYGDFFLTCIKLIFLVFLGFAVCNPFFIISFGKFSHNLVVYSKDIRHYTAAPAIFGITHLKELMSLVYFNLAGFLIILLGLFYLFLKERRLFIAVSFLIVIFEIYFGIYSNRSSPLRYLNPLMPAIALIFGWGVNFILERKRSLIPAIVIFFILEGYSCFGMWQALSFKPSFTQEARRFIEKNIPEFANICITANTFMPQLNMTRESYWHLVKTAPTTEEMKGYKDKLDYINMDDSSRYDNNLREIRIESLAKKPQYNLLRWDSRVNTEEEARSFLKDKAVKYIICYGILLVGSKNLSDIKGVSLIKEFKPANTIVYGRESLYLYRVEAIK